jgi:hypothetical protein
MKRETKISILWIVIMCGFAFHIIADVLPIFWGENVAVSNDGNTPTGLMTLMMAASYTIPVIGILLAICKSVRVTVATNLALSLVLLAFNIFHSFELLDPDPVQVCILPLILLVNIILSFEIWKLLKMGTIVPNQ